MLTPEKCIPNCVGRLDPVVDAIRNQDWPLAEDLCQKEYVRRARGISQMIAELEVRQSELKTIENFLANIWIPAYREQCVEEAGR